MLALNCMLRTSPPYFGAACITVTITITFAVALAIAIATAGAIAIAIASIEDTCPVRALVVSSSNVGIHAEFLREIRARIESRLPFRAPGKITARKLEPGTFVTRGKVLMQLDAQDLPLSR